MKSIAIEVQVTVHYQGQHAGLVQQFDQFDDSATEISRGDAEANGSTTYWVSANPFGHGPNHDGCETLEDAVWETVDSMMASNESDRRSGNVINISSDPFFPVVEIQFNATGKGVPIHGLQRICYLGYIGEAWRNMFVRENPNIAVFDSNWKLWPGLLRHVISRSPIGLGNCIDDILDIMLGYHQDKAQRIAKAFRSDFVVTTDQRICC